MIMNRAVMAGAKLFLIFWLVLYCLAGSVCAQAERGPEQLYSPLNARTFHKIAYELGASADIDRTGNAQAMSLLSAARTLDSRAEYVFADILDAGSRFTDQDYFDTVLWAFERYADKRADLQVSKIGVRYLLESLDSREAREELLARLLGGAAASNSVLSSQLATELALLSAEKADFSTAINYLMQAYDADPYNRLAFVKLDELGRTAGQTMTPAAYAKHLRLSMAANPIDINTAFEFAQFTERLEIYDVAAAAYQYCVELFKYLNPRIDLPSSLYLPWAITYYHTKRNAGRCLQIAEQIRSDGRFDIVLEAIAAAAARKLGDTAYQQKILSISRQAEKMLGPYAVSLQVTAEQLAWFYCFALPDASKALAWANRAYSADPNSSSVNSLFACTLAMNNQFELAGELAGNLQKTNQIAAVTMAMVQLAAGKKGPALETLKSAVAMDSVSLAAEKAKQLLHENGSEYIPSVSGEIILKSLKADFGERIVPDFAKVDELISAKLSFAGSEFFYGGDFGAALIVQNKSSEPLVISDDGMFRGDIRVDADIRGDINVKIEWLISKRFRPSAVINPGQYASIPLELMTGRLRDLLLTHPQASVEIEFTAYLDPVADDAGKVKNSLPDMAPIRIVVKRDGVNLTRKYLMQRLETAARGQPGQKVRAARLFAGLLAEQQSVPAYRYMHVDSMLLRDALRRSLSDEDWTVKLQTMAAMLIISSPLDYELTRSVSEGLNDSHWPVRMMALYLLAKSQPPEQFKPVLGWTVKYDSHWLVRNMAVASGAARPAEEPQSRFILLTEK